MPGRNPQLPPGPRPIQFLLRNGRRLCLHRQFWPWECWLLSLGPDMHRDGESYLLDSDNIFIFDAVCDISNNLLSDSIKIFYQPRVFYCENGGHNHITYSRYCNSHHHRCESPRQPWVASRRRRWRCHWWSGISGGHLEDYCLYKEVSSELN